MSTVAYVLGVLTAPVVYAVAWIVLRYIRARRAAKVPYLSKITWFEGDRKFAVEIEGRKALGQTDGPWQRPLVGVSDLFYVDTGESVIDRVGDTPRYRVERAIQAMGKRHRDEQRRDEFIKELAN